MNELELLRHLRADLPAVRPESRATARAALMARVESGEQSAPPRPVPPWQRPRLRLAAASAALAALLIALPLGILGGGGEAQPALAQVLRETAHVALAQQPIEPGPNQFLFTRSKTAYLGATPYLPAGKRHPCTRRNPCDMTGAPEWSALMPMTRESWISLDGSRQGRVRAVSGEPRFVSADQRAGWIAAGSPPLPQAGQVEDSPLSGSVVIDTSKLPTDPAALRRQIEAREIPGVEGPPGETETFTLIGDMLRETYLPAEIRAALYQLTAELPGVELLGEVEDPVGRPGTGIAFTDRKRGTKHELIFDPETSNLLGERESIVRSGPWGFEAPPGTPIGYAAYLEEKVVDSIGSDAPAGAGAPDTSVGCYNEPTPQANATIVHGADPIATCAKLWREGIVDYPNPPSSPHLVACYDDISSVAHVYPGPGPAVCRRLGLEQLPTR